MKSIYEAHFKANKLLDSAENQNPDMRGSYTLEAVRGWLDVIVEYVEKLERRYDANDKRPNRSDKSEV